MLARNICYFSSSQLAEREGFEPPIRLPVCRISSAVLSTTQPPLRKRRRKIAVSGGYVSSAIRQNKGAVPWPYRARFLQRPW
ncbi:MAG: hypothetical protein QOD29_3709 [Alphaproteobacteria bacterium]|jgi:hypothetical protein|nr:hypothetical protein [Alphaproteobacteria bacterium]